MATNSLAYMSGRKKYQRPQGMLWSNNPGVKVDGVHIPDGLEMTADLAGETEASVINQFLILSDDNRGAIDFKTERIETRERMINGRMRSFHIADKRTISVSWQMLPSRSFAKSPLFDAYGKPSNDIAVAGTNQQSQAYTTDGGAGGAEILDWYETHTGSFWVFLSYDKYTNFGKDDAAYNNLSEYSQVVEMFISDFSYSVEKRGGSNYDFWNINVTLEEV